MMIGGGYGADLLHADFRTNAQYRVWKFRREGHLRSTKEQLERESFVFVALTQLETYHVMDHAVRCDEMCFGWTTCTANGSTDRRSGIRSDGTRITSADSGNTSFTTSAQPGVPKGVMITHGTWRQHRSFPFELFNISRAMIAISFLRLAQLLRRHVDIGLLNRVVRWHNCPDR